MTTMLLMLLALSALPPSIRPLTAHTARHCAARRPRMCSCRPVLQPVAAAERASLVLQGTVIAFRDSVLSSAYGRGRVRVAHVRVSASWKPAPVDSVVHIATSWDSCAFQFKVGEDYLIYAAVDRQLAMPTTSMCTRTQPASGASADLQALGKPTGKIGR